MVFFATSRAGYESYLSLGSPSPLWVSAGVLSALELGDLRARGVKVTNFTHEVRAEDPEALAEALETIREHHPDETVWVEGLAGR